ncbi:MAG: TaqI-like C-terminal specificity domain-containing protein, partial [Promethearchaeota archaeon]
VIDHSFLDLPSYEEVREYLLSNYHVSFILSNYNYRKTAIVDLSLLVIRNSQSSQPTIWQETLEEETRIISKEHFLAQPNCSYQYKEEFSSLFYLNNYTLPLSEIASVSCGLEYGALLKTNFLSSKPSKGFHKCIDGSNGLSHPFILFWIPEQSNSYVRFDKEYERKLQDENKNVSRTKKKVILISGKLDRFSTEKIILRQTAPRFIATLDTQKFLTLRNTHLIYYPKPPYSLYLILGIFCSSLGNYIGEHFNIIRTSRKGSSRYPQIRLNDLKNFPIIDINQIEDTSIINQVEVAVKECLNIGESITAALTNLWANLETEPISPRQFLKIYLERDHLTPLPERDTIKQIHVSILEELSKLTKQRKIIDSLIFRLYNINQQDQRKIISKLKE